MWGSFVRFTPNMRGSHVSMCSALFISPFYKQWVLSLVILLITSQICCMLNNLRSFSGCSSLYCAVLCCVCVFSTQIHMHSLDTFRSACDFPVGQSTSVGCCLHHLFNNVESKSRCLLYVGDWGQSRSNVLSCFDAFDFRFGSRAFIMNAWHVNGATTTKNQIRRQKTRLLLASIHFFSSLLLLCCNCCCLF